MPTIELMAEIEVLKARAEKAEAELAALKNDARTPLDKPAALMALMQYRSEFDPYGPIEAIEKLAALIIAEVESDNE
jgi:hypothetical protein